MARNPETERILDAWWELQHSVPSEREESQREFNKLLDAVILKSDGLFTREQIQDYLCLNTGIIA
jgi:hypothetical protein